MQEDVFFVSNNGIGVSFCIENRLVKSLSLSLTNLVLFPEKKSSADKVFFDLFEKIFLYLEGKNVDFSFFLSILNLNFISEFQKRVYNILLEEVCYGSYISYEDVAVKLGNKNLKRAVGRALGLNPFPLLIPCHRVVPKNFSSNNIGGYSEGIEIKEKLLMLEKIL